MARKQKSQCSMRSGKPSTQGKGKTPAMDGDEIIRTKANDPSWYASNPSLLRDSASYSFNNPIGNAIDMEGSVNSGYFSVPGVCSIRLMPTVGISHDATSPVNIAARNIYSFVRHANSGHTNYESQDLMIYLIAMDQVYSMLAFCTRAYGVLGTYSQTNRYLPRACFNSMRLDFDDFIVNIADFRYFVNNLAVKVGSMCIPNTMSYLTRHMWMYSNIYKDSESSKAGLYLYNPWGFYLFEPTTATTGGKLTFKPFEGTAESELMTFAELKAYVESLIQPILTDEDMNIMSGDILKAFTPNGVFKVGPVEESYSVVPVHQYEVLNQMNNATLMGLPTIGSTSIYQGDGDKLGNLLFEPQWNLEATKADTIWALPVIFNSYHDSPTPEEVMVGSRLTNTCVSAQNAGGLETRACSSCGSEIAVEAELFYFYGTRANWRLITPNATPNLVKYKFIGRDDVGSVPMSLADLNSLAQLENFDWHPQVFVVPYTGGTTINTSNVQLPYADLDNYTILHDSDLRKMHETALLSQFSVPQMGSWNNKLS